MPPSSLTREEFEQHLVDLAARLREHLDGSGESPKQLLRDAEHVFELADEFPDVMARHEDVEGLVAALLARRQQEKFAAGASKSSEPPGCLLGLLLRRRGRT